MIDIKLLYRRDDLGGWLNLAGLTGVGVEVGTLYGEFMETIMNQWDGQLLHCIDPWERQPDDVYREPVNRADWGQIYKSAKSRADGFPMRVNLIRGYSPQESGQFPDGSLDFVYLDGRHDFDAITADLHAWWPKVKRGGLFGGHDYRVEHNDTQCCDVKITVDAFAVLHKLPLHNTYAPGDQGWWIIKP